MLQYYSLLGLVVVHKPAGDWDARPLQSTAHLAAMLRGTGNDQLVTLHTSGS